MECGESLNGRHQWRDLGGVYSGFRGTIYRFYCIYCLTLEERTVESEL